jgi:DNA polymerase-3 subunit alpha
VINLPSTRCTPETVDRLRDILATHPGVTEVRLRLMTRTSTRVMRLDDRLRVSPSPSLSGELKELLGPHCLSGV